jgi:hypothetical protein
VKRYVALGNSDFLEHAADALSPVWGTEGARLVSMPLHFLCGRHRGG